MSAAPVYLIRERRLAARPDDPGCRHAAAGEPKQFRPGSVASAWGFLACQSAFKKGPLSASKRDPFVERCDGYAGVQKGVANRRGDADISELRQDQQGPTTVFRIGSVVD